MVTYVRGNGLLVGGLYMHVIGLCMGSTRVVAELLVGCRSAGISVVFLISHV